MPPSTIREAPALDSFTPLAEHQSQTPTSFYNTKPVLYFHSAGARAIGDQVSKLPIFGEENGASSTEATGERSSKVETVDAYITSENLTLFNTSKSIGVSIPYPAISLHAIQRLNDPANPSEETQGLYMQLELSDPYAVDEDENMDVVEITLIPSPSSTDNTTTSIQALFEAVSTCSNLNPDPTDQDDEDMDDAGGDSRIVFEGSIGYEGISGLPGVQQGVVDGGLPPPFPGSGGWITAENVSEYFDEGGNWIGGGDEGSLGEGAGRVRTRDETDGVNGNGDHEADDSKRARTD